MKVASLLILLILIVGCKTKQPPLPPPKKEFHFLNNQPQAVTNKESIFPFKYPDDGSNYTWAVQVSSNLVDWITVADGMGWPPSTNSDIYTQSTNSMKFYRMWGHK